MSSIAAWLERHAAFQPDRIALIMGESTISYREFAARVRSAAVQLRESFHIRAGDRVAWFGHNDTAQLIFLFACARIGAIFLPLNWRLSPTEIATILIDASPRVVVVHRSCADRLADLDDEWEKITVDVDLPGCRRCVVTELDDDAVDLARIDDGASLLMVYTSGTTGRPKGAVLSQSAMLFNALNAVHMHSMTPDDRILTVLPMFHVGGLNIQTMPALYCGATVILESRFEPTRTLELIEAQQPTLTVQVPATLQALLEHPQWADANLSSLRSITTGSTDVPVPLIQAIHDRGIPVIQIYGATETGPVAVYQRTDEAFTTAGAIGRPGLHTELKLVDSTAKTVDAGNPGEVWLRGPHLADGYWQAEQAGVEPFHEGWFASGDVAQYDENGVLWFCDRIKHVIISGGENIYPAEIERLLHNTGLVRECAVVGRPDEQWGEVPVVVAVAGNEPVDEAAILASFEGNLASYKHPKDVIVIDALPRNSMGKIDVEALRQLIR